MLDAGTPQANRLQRLSLWLALAVAAAASSLNASTQVSEDDAGTAKLSSQPVPAQMPESEAGLADRTAENQNRRYLAPQVEEINLLQLLVQGGALMVPILFMSLVVVTFAIERLFGLRRSRVLPPGLIRALGELGDNPPGFDPKLAYRICQQFPSAAATVVRAMLLKIGRPHNEVEHAVAEASDREAARLYTPVRWLNLAATVTPLIGLLGTVWGMIIAFHDTTQLGPGQNKGDYLAKGIYIALVTTLGGLTVAIPAAVFSHFFEGRIQSVFHQIDELLFNLMPQIERFEGRVRFGRQVSPGTSDVRESTLEPPVQDTTHTHRSSAP